MMRFPGPLGNNLSQRPTIHRHKHTTASLDQTPSPPHTYSISSSGSCDSIFKTQTPLSSTYQSYTCLPGPPVVSTLPPRLEPTLAYKSQRPSSTFNLDPHSSKQLSTRNRSSTIQRNKTPTLQRETSLKSTGVLFTTTLANVDVYIDNQYHTRRRHRSSSATRPEDKSHSQPLPRARPPRQRPLVIQPDPPSTSRRSRRHTFSNTDTMCQTEQYSYVYPDGRKASKSQRRTTLCQDARGGRPCPNTTLFKHPAQTVSYSTSAPTSTPFLTPNRFPPTPDYSPRSSTPTYHSGNESDRSGGYRSGSSSSRQRSRRSTASYTPDVYVNGQRIMVVNGPPTPVTPPQNYTFPNTAPSSPVAPYVVNASPRHSSRRPMIVDDRVYAPRRTHTRNVSSSSYSTEEESTSSRRRQRDADREARKEAERHADMQARIQAANAKIANRPEVPFAPRRSNTSYHQEVGLNEEMERLNLREGRRRQERREHDALEDRLRARQSTQPTRRATVGPGSRRPRVHYEDGVTRWE